MLRQANRVVLAPVLVLVSLCSQAACLQATTPSTDDRSSDRAYIRDAESDWAESVASNAVQVLERILSDDFVGVDIDGSHYSKANAIKDYRSGVSSYVFDHLDEVEIRFYGNAAVAQGSESWKKKDGTAGRFVWTDTWIKTDGKWKIVAAEDLVPPAPTPAK